MGSGQPDHAVGAVRAALDCPRSRARRRRARRARQGITGFGNAVVATALLATVLEPSRAVVVLILPLLATNLSLVRELDRAGIAACVRRFWPYVGAALVGTVLGMVLIDRIPGPLLALVLGTITAVYVLFRQPYVQVPGLRRLQSVCFRPGPGAKGALGFVSGLVLGASNIGVQVVAYLDALDLDRPTFIGVLAMILVGVSTVRVAVALGVGLYGPGTLPLSLVAVLPALGGVAIGRRLRGSIPERFRTAGTVALLSLIAVRLLSTGVAWLGGVVQP